MELHGGDGLRGALGAHRQADQRVDLRAFGFAHPVLGTVLDASYLGDRFYDAARAAGMGARCGQEAGINFHSLRHTFGTRRQRPGRRCARSWSGWATATWRPR